MKKEEKLELSLKDKITSLELVKKSTNLEKWNFYTKKKMD